VNLQLLIDEEQTILMKNNLLVAEGDSETIGKVSNDINKHVISYYVLHVSGVPLTLTLVKWQLLDALCVTIII
jgi:hypothetical protein